MKIIRCNSGYSEEILEIFNDTIANSTALYDYKPRSIENITAWFENKRKHNFPVIGLVNDQHKLLGFGSYGTFRAWPAYKYTVELSLYIHKTQCGKGLGKIILAEIIKEATKQGFHCLIAGIDSTNEGSKRLHQAFGFEFSGRIKHAGYKFSTWLDLDFYQLLLPTPENPNEE